MDGINKINGMGIHGWSSYPGSRRRPLRRCFFWRVRLRPDPDFFPRSQIEFGNEGIIINNRSMKREIKLDPRLFVEKRELSKGMKLLKPKPPKPPKLLPLRAGFVNDSHEPGHRLADSLRREVLDRDKECCRYCGHFVFGGRGMHVHHLSSTKDEGKNLVTCCVACHTVQHVGRGLDYGSIEICLSPVSQVEIVRKTREGINAGKTYLEINKQFRPKRPGRKFKLNYVRAKWDGEFFVSFATYLDKFDKSARVVFVKFKSWQLD